MTHRAFARWTPVLAGVLAGIVFLGSVGLAVRDLDFHDQAAFRRLWADLAQGIEGYLDAVRPQAQAKPPDPSALIRTRAVIQGWIRGSGARATRPLATLPDESFLHPRLRSEPRSYDDHGRGALLAWAFRLRGGIAPYLIVWLAAVCALPLVLWGFAELWGAGMPRAAVVWALLLSLVPFVPETLALTRYAVGFYLVGVLLLVPLSVFACAGRPSVAGLAARTAVASGVFAICVFCRSSALVLLPGFVAALAIGAWRASRGWGVRGALLASGVALLLLPLPLARGAQQNDVWQPVWEGLGDFDRSKGFTWADSVAERAARNRGAPGLWTPRSEAVFRSDVLFAIRDDPAWYAGILARRLAATVTLWRLWPWTPRDGTFIREASSPNEGVIDKYWTYTTTIDHVGVGPWRLELPILLLVAPSLALAWRARGSSRARRGLAILGCLALGTLALPVAITTAGGSEAQSFGVVYLLGAALLTEATRGPQEYS